jgi:putative molybdopterin biosynthesis protein
LDSDYLTPEEAAGRLKLSKYTVYEMVKRGQLPAKRLGRKILIALTDLDVLMGEPISGGHSALTSSSTAHDPNAIYFSGSHDLSIDILSQHLNDEGISLYPVFSGSLEGLMELFKGRVDMAGCHLLDPELGMYNRSFISRLLPQENMTLVHFVERWQGFIVPKGNPREISSWEDFFSGAHRIVNRQKGSGTRVLLDYQMQKRRLLPENLPGYAQEERNHYATASAVLRGTAHVALGIESAARQLGLDFIPVEKEQYDFVLPSIMLKEGRFQRLLQVLLNERFQQEVSALGGYDLKQMGQTVALN